MGINENVEKLQRLLTNSKYAGLRRAYTGKYDSGTASIQPSRDTISTANKVWVRYTPNGDAFEAWNLNKVNSFAINVPVLVGYDINGELTVFEVINADAYNGLGENASSGTAPQRIITETDVVRYQAINQLRPSKSANGGLFVDIAPYLSPYGYYNGEEIDYSPYNSVTASYSKWVVAYFNTLSLSMGFVEGAEILTASISLTDIFDITIPNYGIPVCALALINGQTSYSFDELVDIRGFINNVSYLPVESAVVSNPPTALEIEGVFGTVKSGFSGIIIDSSDTYFCVYNGTGWYYAQFTQAL